MVFPQRAFCSYISKTTSQNLLTIKNTQIVKENREDSFKYHFYKSEDLWMILDVGVVLLLLIFHCSLIVKFAGGTKGRPKGLQLLGILGRGILEQGRLYDSLEVFHQSQ